MKSDHQNIIQNAQLSSQHGQQYDVLWESWGEINQLRGYAKARTDFIDYVIKKYIQPQKTLNILDLGCGTGWLTAYLSQYGNADGVDFAPKTIEQAQLRFKTGANYHLADPHSPTLGLPSHHYQLLIASEVIEHVTDHQAFVEQLALLTTDDSWCIITTPNKFFWDYYQTTQQWKIFQQPIENWLTYDELNQLLSPYFEIVWSEGWADNTQYTFGERIISNRYIRKMSKILGLYHYLAHSVMPQCFFMMVACRRVSAK